MRMLFKHLRLRLLSSHSPALFGALVMGLGDATQWPLPTGDLWVSQPQVIEAQVGRGALWLHGRKIGRAFVSGIPGKDAVQEVVVLPPQDAKALFQCPGSTWEFSSTIPKLTQGNPRFWNCRLSQARLDPALALSFQEEMLRRLGKDALGLQYFEEQFWCAGQSCPATVARRLGALASFLGSDSGKARPESLVIEISLAEVSRSRAHQLGLQIPTEFNLETSKRWAKQLTAQFGGQGGFARVLAQPQLRTIPGERARFQSGGEVPITTVSVEKINTTFKPYGLIVDITPSATPRRSSQVELQFSVELSEPQWKAKVDGPPSFSMRKLDSRFRVPTAEWVLLTSMQESRLGRQNSGVFGLKDIPGLGSLFGLENLFGEDAELWFALRASWSEIDVGTWSASSSR